MDAARVADRASLRRCWQLTRQTAAIVLVAGGTVLLLSRFVAPSTELGVALASLAPLAAAAAVAAVVVDRDRRSSPRTGAAVAMGAMSLLFTGLLWPLPVGSAAEPSDGVLILTSNLRAANPSLDAALDDVFASEADVILLQEVTVGIGEMIEAHPSIDEYPYRVFDTRDGHYGSVILSRLAGSGEAERIGGWPATTFRVESVGEPFELVNVHLSAPVSGETVDMWRRQLASLEALAGAAVPTVVIGDFNATHDHRQFRSVLDAGFDDVTRQRRWVASWPVRPGRVPLLHLDHVLVPDAMCGHRVDAVEITGSDHVAFTAEIGWCDD